MIDPLWTHPTIAKLGWTLVHFIWQGALVAGALALILRWMRDRSPRARYTAGLAALACCLLMPLMTWQVLLETPVPTSPVQEMVLQEPAPSVGGAVVGQQTLLQRAVPAEERAGSGALSWTIHAKGWLVPALPWLVAGWILGVAVLSVRLLGGWYWTRRLRRRARPVEDRWRRRFEALARQVGTWRPVRLLVTARTEGPMTAGWLRPVVLVPAGMLSGMPPAQVEAILLHELAHIRRHDYLVGFLQSAVETLLFYHPAVWWISGRVRIEREHCCDDLAAAGCADQFTYARALTGLEEQRSSPVPALAADGGSLVRRIRRLLGQPIAPEAPSGRLVVGTVVAMLLTVGAGTAGLSFDSDGSVHEPAVESPPHHAAFQAIAPADTTEDDSTRVYVITSDGDTLRITVGGRGLDSLGVHVPMFDQKHWNRWEDSLRARVMISDFDPDRWSQWADSLRVSFPDPPPVPILDSLDVRVPDADSLRRVLRPHLRVMDSLRAQGLFSRPDSLPRVFFFGRDSVRVPRPPDAPAPVMLDSLMSRVGVVTDSALTHAFAQSDSLLHAFDFDDRFDPDDMVRIYPERDTMQRALRAERRALERAAERLADRAEALERQGHDEAARALREESRRLQREAERLREREERDSN